MPKKTKDYGEIVDQTLGVLSVIALILIFGAFLLGIMMIPNMLLFIQNVLNIDEFSSQIILFILFLLGLAGIGYLTMGKIYGNK